MSLKDMIFGLAGCFFFGGAFPRLWLFLRFVIDVCDGIFCFCFLSVLVLLCSEPYILLFTLRILSLKHDNATMPGSAWTTRRARRSR